MTISKLYTVWCDGDPHAEGCPVWIAHCMSRTEAWGEAKAAGWKRGTSRQYLSPQCAAVLGETLDA